MKNQNVTSTLNKLRKRIDRAKKRAQHTGLLRTMILKIKHISWQDYEYSCKREVFEAERAYNNFIEANELNEEKIVIDSFLFRLVYEPYKVLEEVEVDLPRRLLLSPASRSSMARCFEVCETDQYKFYFCERSLLRHDKNTKVNQYLGECEEPVAYFKGWF